MGLEGTLFAAQIAMGDLTSMYMVGSRGYFPGEFVFFLINQG